MTEQNLFRLACKSYPHNEHTSRLVIHKLRAKYIKCLMYLGNKWIMHHSNQIKHKGN